MVAPPVGAWIEITHLQEHNMAIRVAPPVGAWIEIQEMFDAAPNIAVAPPVGAWIEICTYKHHLESGKGRSPRGSVD